MAFSTRALRPLPVSERVLAGLRSVLYVLSALMVLTFLVTAYRRLHYAFAYDWIEEGVLASVQHIRAGLPLYQAPSVSFTPYLYTPVYLYSAAALAKFAGPGYTPLRLLSIFATLGCFAALYALVHQEVRRPLAACAAVGLFASCYPEIQFGFDIGRVDMLYLFFVLWALYATRKLHPVLAAVLWVCAFQTKQSVLPIAVLALCSDWHRPRRLALALTSFFALLGGSLFWLNHATQGWYGFYVFGVAGGFGYVAEQVLRFLPNDLFKVCGIAVLVILAALVLVPPTPRGRAFSFYTLASVGLIGFTAYVRFHRGANGNALIPMYAWIAVLFGISLGRLATLFEAEGSAAAKSALAMLWLAAGVQLFERIYSPGEFQPPPERIQFRKAFQEQVRSIPGDVLVLSHPEQGVAAGKPLYAGSESVGAVIEAQRRGPGDSLIAQYVELLHRGTVKAVILDRSAEQYAELPRVWMPHDFLSLYPLRVPALGAQDQFFGSEPRWVYLPCSSAALALRLDPGVDTSACAGH